ncbi:MAG: post-COAP-1 domain-containing protein [Myxococcales bacterium]
MIVPLAMVFFAACGPASDEFAASGDSSDSISLVSAAATAPSLGSAASFAVLAGTAVTCTDATVTGNVGVYPGVTITQTSCPVTGTIDAGDSVAAQAHNDFVLAYDAFKALPCGKTLTTLDGQTLSAGVFCFDAAATSTGGVLTLDGPSDGIWIFKIGSLGTGALTGTNFTVVKPDGSAPPCNSVYWWVAEAATMTDSKFVGTILAGAAITLTRGTFNGNAYALAATTITGAAATACTLGGGTTPSCKGSDRVTGGGWIRETPYHAKGTFSVSGGIKHETTSGHLTYEDHGRNGPKVSGARVTSYIALDKSTRRIEGTANVNGRAGFTFRVDVSDNGEPGRNDTFAIHLSNGYTASGTVAGGNIQLHKAHGRGCDEKDHDEAGHHDDHDDHDD